MRTRSSSIYTKRPNVEPPQVAGRSSLPNTLPDFPDVDLSPPPLKKASSATDVETMFDDFGPLVDKRIKEDFSGDFAKDNRSSIEAKNPRYSIDDFLSNSNFSTTNSTCSSVSNLSNLSNVSNTSSASCRICPVTFSTVIFDDYFGLKTMEKPQKMFKGMMIGTQSAGKRSLLQAMFPEHKVTIPIAKQPFDLMTKTIEKSKIINRYHFWLKEPNIKDKRLAPLINMYYKNCSVFFLVYNPDVKASFEELEAELKLIHQVHSQKELFLILIGNRRGSKQPHKVTAADITSLKEKYDIKFSLVLDVAKGVPADLRNFADSFLR